MISLLASLALQSAAFTPEPPAAVQIDVSEGAETAHIREGLVWLDAPEFTNGTLEFDLLMEPGRAFTGIMFRAQDADNGEMFYFRHHQRGLPDAWQYHPRRNGHQAYQIYQGEGFAGAFETVLGEWVRIRMEILDGEARIYQNDVLAAQIPDLQETPMPGRVAIWALRGERSVRNVSYQPEVAFEPVSVPAGAAPPPPPAIPPRGELITTWKVSPVLSSDEAHRLAGREVPVMRTMKASHRGIVDLNAAGKLDGDNNTLIARTLVEVDTAHMAWLDFGYSDDVTIYLNGAPVYAGGDRFRSRDYRFLGTVGFFDSLPLNLRAGTNMIDFVVTEVEGGWAVAGSLREAPDR